MAYINWQFCPECGDALFKDKKGIPYCDNCDWFPEEIEDDEE